MDDRTKLEKILALLNHPTTDAKIRAVAQSMFDKMRGNSELAINPTCEEAYQRYTEAYTHTTFVGKMRLPKVNKPEAVCNDLQMAKIFKTYATWPDILVAMRRCVGGIGNIVLTETEYLKEWEKERTYT